MKTIRRIFIIYVIALTIVLLFKSGLSIYSIMDRISSVKTNREMGIWNFNLIPLKTIVQQVQQDHLPLAANDAENIIGNIIIFVPFGILFPLAFQTRFGKTISIGILYILIIETIQFISMLGIFDVDDMILNTTGICCGYLILKIIKQLPHHL